MTDTARALAPYVILLAAIGVLASVHLDASATQLLSTIVGVVGGVMIPRRAEGVTTTVTAGDPPTVTTGPKP